MPSTCTPPSDGIPGGGLPCQTLSALPAPRNRARRASTIRREGDALAIEGSLLARHPICTCLRLIGPIVPNRGALMSNISRFETLTKRHVLIQETTKKFISDLQRMVQLLEADINIEEDRTGIFDLTKPDYSVVARQLRARHDNLKATIFRLEGIGSTLASSPSGGQLRRRLSV
jgi:hypothetical protein